MAKGKKKNPDAIIVQTNPAKVLHDKSAFYDPEQKITISREPVEVVATEFVKQLLYSKQLIEVTEGDEVQE